MGKGGDKEWEMGGGKVWAGHMGMEMGPSGVWEMGGTVNVWWSGAIGRWDG